MNITLKEITSETVLDVIRLSVLPEQQAFVAPNATSLAEALFSEEAWYRAIYSSKTLVGFVMVYDESQRKDPPEKPNIGLWRLMIDHQFQRMGIGREVVRQIIEYAKSKNKFTALFTSYVPDPLGPEAFYLSLGFIPNGEIEDGETIVLFHFDEKAD
jgi:diamine N-acetyltransferase